MVNVFRLCSIINSLYGQVAGDLETCSWLCRIMPPPRLRARRRGGDMIWHSREQVSKFGLEGEVAT